MPWFALAEEASEQDVPRIAYRGEGGCPDENAFIDQVRSRTPRAALAREGDAAAFAVTVKGAELESSGRVERNDAGGANLVRHITGKTCEEVVAAAALITALGLEARLAQTDVRPAAAPASNEKVPDGVESPAARPPAISPWSAGATFGVDSWSAPGGALTAGGFTELGSRAPLRYVRLRIRGASGSTVKDLRGASFLLTAGGLTLCPMGLDVAARLEVAPCAGVELGNLHGRGLESAALPNPRSADILWAAAYADLRARWRLTEIVSLELTGEIGVPLVRHDFTFDAPPDVIYQVPAFGAGGTLGAVVHFP